MKILLVFIVSVFSLSCSLDRSEFSCDENDQDDTRTCKNGIWVDRDDINPNDMGSTDTDTKNDVTCIPETDDLFCSRLAKNCGIVTEFDNCDGSRSVDCGSCTSPESCADNVCGCDPESDADFCERLIKDCGSVQQPDNCGLPRTADCGVCDDDAKVCPTANDVQEQDQNVCACPGQDNDKICTDKPAECGQITVSGLCGEGGDVTINCGDCAVQQACSISNKCVPDVDSDGVPDAIDNCPDLANLNQADGDNDGVGDACDNCPQNKNTNQADSDGDDRGDVCDNCPEEANANQADNDNDGVGNFCDNCVAASNSNQSDSDSDGVGNICDNCRNIANSNQTNSDTDAFGDVCDNCPLVGNPAQTDSDNDGIGNACESCGNGNLQLGEGCDDGNVSNNDGCNEFCDIENTHSCNLTAPGYLGGFSCSSGICNTAGGPPGVCAAADTCGNNILDTGEGCDDGNNVDGDDCNNACQIKNEKPCNAIAPGSFGAASCASGICNTTGGNPGLCQPADTCGNNVLETGEGCDDGNTIDGDGCNGDCDIENDEMCNTTPPGNTGNASCASGICNKADNSTGTCMAAGACGNNILDSGEGCDDGNKVDGDGCNGQCEIENGTSCNQTPPGETGDDSCASGNCQGMTCAAN